MKPIEISMRLKMKQTEAETSTRFQIEPTRFQSGLDTDSMRLPKQFSTERLQPGINSLVLAMRFRDCLSEQEQNLLDLLAPDKGLSFLIKGQRFLHPAGVSLFPLDMLESLSLTGGNAILSLRYRPKVATDIDCYRLQAVRISSPSQTPLILGMLEPEPTLNNGGSEIYFARLATEFRLAWQTTTDLAATISPELRSDYPTMVINRSAGRPLVANRQLAALAGISQDQLINREYSELAAKLSEPIRQNRLTLKNISTDNFDLCVASIQPARSQPDRTSGDSQLTGFLIHAMRNKLAAIIAASSHIHSRNEDQLADDTHELTDIILEEAAKMDRHLSLFDLLANFGRCQTRPTSISEELHRATNMISGQFSRKITINIATDPDRPLISVPTESLSLLFEAILSAHLLVTRSEDSTAITLTYSNNKTCLKVITTLSEAASKIVQDKNWRQVADKLASLLNFKLGQNDIESRTLETNLEISTGAIQDVTN